MKPFDVEWLPEAEDELAVMWLNAVDRPAVTAAQARADQLLARDPDANGRHLSEGLYAIDVLPLRLNYTINRAARKVEVSEVAYLP
jgi:hypothetical protein